MNFGQANKRGVSSILSRCTFVSPGSPKISRRNIYPRHKAGDVESLAIFLRDFEPVFGDQATRLRRIRPVAFHASLRVRDHEIERTSQPSYHLSKPSPASPPPALKFAWLPRGCFRLRHYLSTTIVFCGQPNFLMFLT